VAGAAFCPWLSGAEFLLGSRQPATDQYGGNYAASQPFPAGNPLPPSAKSGRSTCPCPPASGHRVRRPGRGNAGRIHRPGHRIPQRPVWICSASAWASPRRKANIPWAPAFLAPIAEKVRSETGMPVASSWSIDATSHRRPGRCGKPDGPGHGGARPSGQPSLAYQAAKALGDDQTFVVLPAPYAHWLERYSSN